MAMGHWLVAVLSWTWLLPAPSLQGPGHSDSVAGSIQVEVTAVKDRSCSKESEDWAVLRLTLSIRNGSARALAVYRGAMGHNNIEFWRSDERVYWTDPPFEVDPVEPPNDVTEGAVRPPPEWFLTLAPGAETGQEVTVRGLVGLDGRQFLPPGAYRIRVSLRPMAEVPRALVTTWEKRWKPVSDLFTWATIEFDHTVTSRPYVPCRD